MGGFDRKPTSGRRRGHGLLWGGGRSADRVGGVGDGRLRVLSDMRDVTKALKTAA
ncbi:hypothetical protein HFP43_22690 [Streptomyces sp. SJ1-7]|nr:hypothetical protein [Streptomyces sp. SJ1-7]